jgi:hypothetical protein
MHVANIAASCSDRSESCAGDPALEKRKHGWLALLQQRV